VDKFLIAPINSGLHTDLVPFLTPEDSFTTLKNMYISDGKIVRRPSTYLLDTTNARGLNSRLRVNIGTTDPVSGDFAALIADFAGSAPALGQQFSVGDTLFTIYQDIGAMKSSTLGVTGNNNIIGPPISVNITGAAVNTIVYWYPSTKVMGMTEFNQEGDILEIAFDQEFAYKFQTTGWERIIGANSKWTSSTIRRYQSENFQGALSGKTALVVAKYLDPLKYYDSTTNVFTNFYPKFSNVANNEIRRCSVIKQYSGHLFLMDTVEYGGGVATEVRHKNRIRWSEFGKIFEVDSWYESIVATNKGGFIDLPIHEEINCCEILNGRLIVFCRDSIYELTSSNNPAQRFKVTLIDSTFGSKINNVIEVNNTLLFVNNYGIYIYDGKNIIKINNQFSGDIESYEYRYGNIYKDSDEELIYILANSEINERIPNIIILYNYKNNTFSLIRDNYTTVYKINHGINGLSYITGIIVCGNHKGYILRLRGDIYKNAISQNIINIVRVDANNINLTIYNHNLDGNDFIRITNSGLVGLNGSYQIQESVDVNTIKILNTTSVDTDYNGDATVLIIDRIDIETKQFNTYMKQGFGLSINKVAFNVNRTTVNGQIALAMRPNGSEDAYITATDVYLGTSYLETIGYNATELEQKRLWHYVYLPCMAESISLKLVYSLNIILDDTLPFQELTINAIMLYTDPAKYI